MIYVLVFILSFFVFNRPIYSQRNISNQILYENNKVALKWDKYINSIKKDNNPSKIKECYIIKELYDKTKVLTDVGYSLMKFKVPSLIYNYKTDKDELIAPVFSFKELEKVINIPELKQSKNEFDYKRIEKDYTIKYKKFIDELDSVKYLFVSTLPFKMGEYNFNEKMFFRYGNDMTNDGQIIEYIHTFDKYNRDYGKQNYSLKMDENEAEQFLLKLKDRIVIYHFVVQPKYFKSYLSQGKSITSLFTETICTIVTDASYNVVYIKK